MRNTREYDEYFVPGFDLFMLTPGELATRALALAEVSCRRAGRTLGPLDGPAARTALRAVRPAAAFHRRAEAEAAAHTCLRSIP
ncbi:hypothetical protein ACWF95_40460 [Streptomyces vinaceus]